MICMFNQTHFNYQMSLKTCLEIYELDPARFISLPSLAWLACLKITKNNFRTVN